MPVLGRHDEYNDFTALLARYREALATLGGWGVRIAPNSRLQAYEGRLHAATAAPGALVTEAFAAQIIVDLREIDEIISIAKSFTTEPTANELLLLRRLAAGAEHPDDERGTPGREAQYELVLRSLLLTRGVAVRVGSPDLTIDYKSHSYPLEAKRPGSLERLDDRLRHAISQLQRQSEIGVIAISLDQVIRPRGKYLTVQTRELIGPAVAALVARFIEDNSGAIVRRVRGKPVAAILFTACLPALAVDTNTPVMGTNNHLEVIAEEGTPGDSIVQCLLSAFS